MTKPPSSASQWSGFAHLVGFSSQRSTKVAKLVSWEKFLLWRTIIEIIIWVPYIILFFLFVCFYVFGPLFVYPWWLGFPHNRGYIANWM